MRKIICLSIVLISLLSACRKPHATYDIACYDWEMHVDWQAPRDAYLQKINAQYLYLKIFETNGSDVLSTHVTQQIPIKQKIVPVIRINDIADITTNRSSSDAASFLLQQMHTSATTNKLNFADELQIDFDYDAKNRDTYFHLLKSIKQQSHLKISITLNLDKLFDTLNLPPVDACMLMLYDFKAIDDSQVPAIFNPEQLKKYTQVVAHYPLPLDFAIPVFARTSITRKGETFYSNTFSESEMRKEANMLFRSDHRYEVIGTFMFEDVYLMKGDEIVFDQVSSNDLREAIQFIKAYHPETPSRISLFSMNDSLLTSIPADTLNQVLQLLK